MANEVVKYKNEMNLVPMNTLNAVEMDLFFAICARMRNKGTMLVRFEFSELRVLSEYKPTSTKRFADDVQKTLDKLAKLTYRENKDGVRKGFVLFPDYEVNEVLGYAGIGINKNMIGILNELERHFTRFELAEFAGIRSVYAKSLYRLLKQFRIPGYYIVTIEDFRYLMDIPEYFKQGNIDQRVLKPALKELAPLYEYLDINKRKKTGRGRGGIVTHLEFTFREKEELIVPLDIG